MTIVCIAGMHRSGTSMITRLLNLCGLYLGKEEELMPSNAYNSDGYWEHLEFVEINDKILSHLNGVWSAPPAADSSFNINHIPMSLTKRAQELIQKFEDKKIWGWKDPRNSLTVPFWQQLIPDLKIIICLRNPLEVAQSLFKRDNFSSVFSFDLWYSYNQRLLSVTSPENRLVTSYNTYFINPQKELQRILKFIGISADQNMIRTACSATMPSLRHNAATLTHLIAEGAPLKVINLYMEMSLQSGATDWNEVKNKIPKDALTAENNKIDIERDLMLKLIQKDPLTQALMSYTAEKGQAIQALTKQAEALTIQLAEQAQVFTTQLAEQAQVFTTQLAEQAQTIQTLTTQLQMREEELLNVYTSRAWHLVQILRRIRHGKFFA